MIQVVRVLVEHDGRLKRWQVTCQVVARSVGRLVSSPAYVWDIVLRLTVLPGRRSRRRGRPFGGRLHELCAYLHA